MKYAYLFIADEELTIEGNIDDFPNNLTLKECVHHNTKVEHNKQVLQYDEEINQYKSKMLEMQNQNLWNHGLQREYLEKRKADFHGK